MTYIVAVSGGVDSVVLLDMMINGRLPCQENRSRDDNHDIIVAHFDHGIRQESSSDAQFVKDLAKRNGLTFESMRVQLGDGASEALAREERYRFLRRVAKKYQGNIMTAHHMNDIAETIAINITRGTGWRGLAVLNQKTILRPLLGITKQEIYAYAKKHQLTWQEDITNYADYYLRNRLRPKLQDDEVVRQLATLRSAQVAVRRSVEELLAALSLKEPYSRDLFMSLNEGVALEIIRFITRGRLTTPQQRRVLHAIRQFRAGTIHQPGGGCELHFTTRYFTIRML